MAIIELTITQCQITQETVCVDQLKITIFLVRTPTLVETAPDGQACERGAGCESGVCDDVDNAQLVTCGSDCAEVAWLSHACWVVVACAQNVDVEDFDTVSNAVRCVIGLATDDQIATIRLIVKDGQNNPINNQRIIFNSSLGEPVDMGTDNDNDDYSEVSGLQGEAGLVLKDFLFHRYECPSPGPAGPGLTTCTITATILGNMVSDTETLSLFRYADFNP
jgi:hypothetical protein